MTKFNAIRLRQFVNTKEQFLEITFKLISVYYSLNLDKDYQLSHPTFDKN